jgi:hypothetical protein
MPVASSNVQVAAGVGPLWGSTLMAALKYPLKTQYWPGSHKLVKPQPCRHHHWEEYAEGEGLIAGAYQALLCQDMWPWISATYPD